MHPAFPSLWSIKMHPIGFWGPKSTFLLALCPLYWLSDGVYAMSSGAYQRSYRCLIDLNDFECIPRVGIAVDSTNMAVVPNSTYTHPGHKFDHKLGWNPISVKSTHLPSWFFALR